MVKTRVNTTVLVIWLLAALVAPRSSAAAVNIDEVTSAKIKEADNNGTQDTNTGAGVKTNHLQNKAVTAAKIADGTITATQLAAGSVTDAKIAGPISTSKLNVGTGAGAVAAGNHNHDTAYQRRYANVVVVAKGGGDFTDLASALGSIADASESKPYLIRIMPGVYDAGGNQINMKRFVDIEGSGEGLTKLLGTTLVVAWDTSVRSLTIQGTTWYGIAGGGSNISIKDVTVSGIIGGIGLDGGSNISLKSVKASESSSGSDHFAIQIANAADVRMHDVTATVGGPDYGGSSSAIYIWYSSNVVLDSVTATAFSGGSSVHGVWNWISQTRISNSYVSAAGPYSVWAIRNDGDLVMSGVTAIAGEGANHNSVGLYGGPQTRADSSRISGRPFATEGQPFVANSMLDGANSGTPKCVGVYNANYDPITCQ